MSKCSPAQAQVTAARDALTQQTTNRATTIAGEQAVVAGDDAAVNNAGQNLSETVLTAPSDGTVARRRFRRRLRRTGRASRATTVRRSSGRTRRPVAERARHGGS